MANRLFTSESVTEGHPDKIADQVSDTVVDALLARDPSARVAVETLITTGQVKLLWPICAQTAAYGRFGRELPEFTWERTDRVGALRAAAGG